MRFTICSLVRSRLWGQQTRSIPNRRHDIQNILQRHRLILLAPAQLMRQPLIFYHQVSQNLPAISLLPLTEKVQDQISGHRNTSRISKSDKWSSHFAQTELLIVGGESVVGIERSGFNHAC